MSVKHEHREQILNEWSLGKSASEIADGIRGLTRSAVCGLVHRARAAGDKRAESRKDAGLAQWITAKHAKPRVAAKKAAAPIPLALAPTPAPATSNARPPRPDDWTPAEDAILRQHVGHKTSIEIAAMFPGRTLSAVRNRAIKKLGLSFEGAPRQKPTGFQYGGPRGGHVDDPEVLAKKRAAIEAASAKLDREATSVAPVSILDLKPRHCRYPLWSGRPSADLSQVLFCGAPTTSEKCSWCAEHRAAVSGTPRGSLSDREMDRAAARAA